MKKLLLLFIIIFSAKSMTSQNWRIIYSHDNVSKISSFGGSFRQYPDVTSKELAALVPGDEIVVLEYSGVYSYYKAVYKGISGYVSVSSLENKMKADYQYINELFIGMTTDQIIYVMGQPKNKSRYTSSYGITEVWEYEKKFLHVNISKNELESWSEFK